MSKPKKRKPKARPALRWVTYAADPKPQAYVLTKTMWDGSTIRVTLPFLVGAHKYFDTGLAHMSSVEGTLSFSTRIYEEKK